MTDLLAATLEAAARRAAATPRALLRAHGVVATPGEVARQAVARVDALLRDELAVDGGLASERVAVLDPAVGTGVFLAAVLAQTSAASGARGPLLGIERDASTLGELASLLGPEAARQGVPLTLRCANTLELADPFPEGDHVRVIVGNPPWAARSESRGGALSDAWLAEFRVEPSGGALRERRVGVLSDDYVRFFRWSLEQARTSRAGALLCLVTNGSYLDGPVHRGMRAALARDFDHIELLDLGGNALLSRGAERDENLFGVRVGAAVTWALRRPGARSRAGARVLYGQLSGARSDKLAALAAGGAALAPHEPSAPWYRFRPVSTAPRRDGFSLDEAFPFQREGVQTNRDGVAIAASCAELEARLWSIARGELRLSPSRHFDPERARREVVAALESGRPYSVELAYRPLDERVLAMIPSLCHRPRRELAEAVARSPLCLLAVRKERGAAPFNLFAPAYELADACYLSTRSSCRTRVFPSHTASGADNLAPSVADELARRVGRTVSAEELITYVLALLGAPHFRAQHDQQLKLDYARLPYPHDGEAFGRASAVGRAFVRALLAPAPISRVELAPGAAPELSLSRERLRHRAADETVAWAGKPVLVGVDEACWRAAVGHHPFVSAPFGRGAAPELRALQAALTRADAWCSAERWADQILRESALDGSLPRD